MAQLPSNTAYTAGLLIEQLNRVEQILARIEKRRAELFEPTPETNLLDSLPGVAVILSVVIGLEVGDIRRFKGARRLAEATYWMLSKKEPYRERGLKQVSSKGV